MDKILKLTGTTTPSGKFNSSRSITFFNSKKVLIGTLDFFGEEITFTGKAAESAQIFFDQVISIYKGSNPSNFYLQRKQSK